MSLLDTHNAKERFDNEIVTWMGSLIPETESLQSQIRYMGVYQHLPKLTDDMNGSIIILKREPYLETYIAVSNKKGEMGWMKLSCTKL